jgi:hypothetical protein
MSGIVGSKLNIRGSGLIGSLGTDGQHLLSAGAGKTNVFETASGGFFGQAVQTNKTDTASSTASSFADTGLEVAITPAATGSKIMVIVSVHYGLNYATIFRLARDIGGAGYAAICIGDADSSRGRASGGSDGSATGGDTGDLSSWCTVFIDSPSTTSEVTYQCQYYVQSGGTGYLNRSREDADEAHCPRTGSQITALEIL